MWNQNWFLIKFFSHCEICFSTWAVLDLRLLIIPRGSRPDIPESQDLVQNAVFAEGPKHGKIFGVRIAILQSAGCRDLSPRAKNSCWQVFAFENLRETFKLSLKRFKNWINISNLNLKSFFQTWVVLTIALAVLDQTNFANRAIVSFVLFVSTMNKRCLFVLFVLKS